MDIRLLVIRLSLLVITLVVLFVMKIILQKIINKIMIKQKAKSPKKTKRYYHFEKLIRGSINIVFGIIMVLVVLDFAELNSVLTALLTFAGVGSLVIGLAAQDIFKDAIAGFMLVTEDNISHDDYVAINGFEGTIEEIKLRHIHLRTYSGQLITIPSGEIDTITNYSRGTSKAICVVDIASNVDVEKAKQALIEAGLSLEGDEEKVTSSVICDGIVGIKNNAYSMRVYVETNGDDYFYMTRKLNEYVIKKLTDENIEFFLHNKSIVKIVKNDDDFYKNHPIEKGKKLH